MAVGPSHDPTLVDRAGRPAVVLETAFLTRGLPEGVGLEVATAMGDAARDAGAEPAFAGVLDGRAIVGLAADELATLADRRRKLSARDLALALATGQSGGTTVAATLALARRADRPVVATGGIGGVHPPARPAGPADVSADLLALATTPAVVVCSGAKSILDLPATLERLESLGVAVVGYRTDELPAFFWADSGLGLAHRVESPAEVAEVWRRGRELGLAASLLVCAPPPAAEALDRAEGERAVGTALADVAGRGARGPDVTPLLLARVAELTDGRSIRANRALLAANAALGAAIAGELDRPSGNRPT